MPLGLAPKLKTGARPLASDEAAADMEMSQNHSYIGPKAGIAPRDLPPAHALRRVRSSVQVFAS